MTDSTPSTVQSAGLLRLCSFMGVFGALCLIGSVIVAPLYVTEHDWIANTISDLGAGEHQRIVDFGLYFYAAALMCLAVGAAHMHPGGVGWSIGILCLLMLGGLVTVIGARNEYGDGDSEGVVIHIYLVYGLGLFFAIAPFAMADGAGPRMALTFRALGGLWVLMAPVFFFLPTDIDGIYERGLGIVALGWTSCLAMVIGRAHRASR